MTHVFSCVGERGRQPGPTSRGSCRRLPRDSSTYVVVRELSDLASFASASACCLAVRSESKSPAEYRACLSGKHCGQMWYVAGAIPVVLNTSSNVPHR